MIDYELSMHVGFKNMRRRIEFCEDMAGAKSGVVTFADGSLWRKWGDGEWRASDSPTHWWDGRRARYKVSY